MHKGEPHLYSYVLNSPVSFSDPLGLKSCFWQEGYDACMKPEEKEYEDCLKDVTLQSEALYQAIKTETDFMMEGCSKKPIPLNWACYLAAGEWLTAHTILAASWVTSATASCSLCYRTAQAACYMGARYSVPDKCPCEIRYKL